MLIIFDCDGVLRSVSWCAMYEAYLAIVKQINRNPNDFWQDAEGFREWHNNDWHYNFARIGITDECDYAPLVKIFHNIYDSSIVKFPWVDEVLDHLKQKGHTLAVLSGARSDSVRGSLARSADFFSTIKGLDHVQRIKPHPEGIHLIMDEINIGPEETIMIGDSDADILAGKNANIHKTIGVTWGMTNLEEMKDIDPDHIFDDPMQLKSF